MAQPVSLRTRWITLRNRLLTDPRFIRFATAIPGIRSIARRRAAGLFDVVAGFVYAQTLAACVELDLFERLRAEPLTPDALDTGLPPAALDRLLRAAASLDLVERLADGRVALGAQGCAVIANPGIAAMVRHHRLLYADLADPVALLKREDGGRLAEFWPYDRSDPASAAAYSDLMAASQPMVAEQALAAYDFGRHSRLLDIGGGHGAFLAAVAARYPGLALTLFDLPAVASGARQVLEQQRLSRVHVVPGSFIDDPLPIGHDAITLVRILHDHGDATVATLLAKVRGALAPGGRLVIIEPMAETPGARAMGDGYFGLYLWAMGQGRPRTAAEYRRMLERAGFTHVAEHKTPLPMIARVLVAH